MSAVKKICLGLLGAAVLLVALGFVLPRERQIERTVLIDAPAYTVFSVVNGFRSFQQWWPWRSHVPGAEVLLEGPDFGTGATLRWTSGNPQVGSGYQEIVASEPYQQVTTRLALDSSRIVRAVYEVEPNNNGTLTRWKVSVDFGMNPVRRYLGLMYERWMGADFDSGLADLKGFVESLPKADWTDLEIEIVEMESGPLAFVATSSTWGVGEIGQAFGEAIGKVERFVKDHELEQAGPPVAISRSVSGEEWRFDAGIPLVAIPDELELDPESGIQLAETFGGRVARAVSVGSYDGISANWERVRAWVAAHGFEEVDSPWEEYISDPSETSEEELTTHLCIPIS